MKIVRFWDMHSGGSQKLDWHYIYIEAPNERIARWYFEETFLIDPDHCTCDTCGADYSVSDDYSDLSQATGFHRHCLYSEEEKGYIEQPNVYHWMPIGDPNRINPGYKTLSEYLMQDDILFVPFEEVMKLESLREFLQDLIKMGE